MAPMDRDFRDLLSEFRDAQVEFLVVGAHALAIHGHIRATKDLDVWVRPDPSNSVRIFAALAAFGAPLDGTNPEEFSRPGLIFQIGVAPNRIDIITSIEGIEFADAWTDRVNGKFFGVVVPSLSRRALMLNKSAAGRPQDLADVDWLRRNPPTT